MPSWKKVITSGSDAILNDLTLSGDIANTSGNFVLDVDGDIELNADGSQITMKDGASSRFTFNLDSTPELDVAGAFTIDCSSDMSIDVAGGNLVLANNGTTRFDFGVDDTPEISTVGDLLIDPSTGNTSFDSHITASGNISSSGTANTFGGTSTFGGNLFIPAVIKHVGATNNSIGFTDTNTITLATEDRLDFTAGGTIICRITSTGANFSSGAITASGGISSSGAAFDIGERIRIGGKQTLLYVDGTNEIRLGNLTQNTVIRGATLSTTANITASGNISSSNQIISKHLILPTTDASSITGGGLSFGTPGNDHGHIYDDGDALQIGYNDSERITVHDTGTNVFINGDLKTTSHITASGNISGSGTGTGSFGLLQVDGGDFTSASLASAIAGGGGGGAVSAVANGVDNRVATFSSADALNGESGLTFDGNDLSVNRDINLARTINHTGDGNTSIGFTDNDIIDITTGGQVTTFNNGHITASGNISASGNAQVNQITASSFQFVGSGNAELEVQGHITASGNISASGNFIGSTRFDITGTTDAQHQGDVVFLGNTTTNNGKIYHYKSNGSWEVADADAASTSDGLLAVALGSNSTTNGMLLRGMVTLDHDPGTTGDVLFLQTGSSGHATSIAPSGNNDIARVVGYYLGIDDGQIWFNPDNTFVEISV